MVIYNYSLFLSNFFPVRLQMSQYKNLVILTSISRLPIRYLFLLMLLLQCELFQCFNHNAGCKESQFYSLPVASIYQPKSQEKFFDKQGCLQFFCNLNSLKTLTCLSDKLRTEFTCFIAKSTSPGLSEMPFFQADNGLIHFCFLFVSIFVFGQFVKN